MKPKCVGQQSVPYKMWSFNFVGIYLFFRCKPNNTRQVGADDIRWRHCSRASQVTVDEMIIFKQR